MSLPRRQFLQNTAAASLAATTLSTISQARAAKAKSPGEKVVVGVMGVNGRGGSLATSFATNEGSELAYVCDVDSRALGKAASNINAKTGKTPQAVADFRRILDDKAVDALVVAAPDHWHAPATILACQAGKHVYCEKPASHNAQEGVWMVQAARDNQRVVQLGTQRRSMPGIVEAVERVKAGDLGRVYYAQGRYNRPRPSIGKGKVVEVPSWLDWKLWQGPAPEQDYRDNLVHYNWHWLWHWGTGELGNNGVHTIDVCRWGLGVDYPTRVSNGGGKFRWDDDQETPDTYVTTYEFGDTAISWEGRSWYHNRRDADEFEIGFFGEQATLFISGGGYAIYDLDGKQIEKQAGLYGDKPHIDDFLKCIVEGGKPRADIEEGHKSTLLCHLGNIAARTQRDLQFDPGKQQIVDDNQAQQFWGRQYANGWQPKV